MSTHATAATPNAPARCEYRSESGRQCRTRTDRRVNGKVACYDHAAALAAR